MSVTSPRSTPETIDDYIARRPSDVRVILKRIRRTIHDAVPDVEEGISYRIPVFKLHGVLVYIAAFTHHIGVYPPVRGNAALERALARYAGEKGNLRFSLDRPIPYALIARIVRFKAKQNRAKQKLPKQKRTK